MRTFATPLGNTTEGYNLKRDKSSFHISTAAFSNSKTLPRNHNDHEDQLIYNNQTQAQNPPRSSNAPFTPTTLTNPHSSSNSSLTSTIPFQILKTLVSHKTSPPPSHQHPHCYYSPCPSPSPRPEIKILSSHQFPPKSIQQLIDRQKQSLGHTSIDYHYGVLEECGYLYFSIGRLLAFVRCLNYLVGTDEENEDPIVLEMGGHALAIKEILLEELQIQDIERHPFGGKSVILMAWFPWRVEFFSYDQYDIVKIKDMNIKFNTACESSFQFDYTKNGDIFYLSQSGNLSKLQFSAPSSFFLASTPRYRLQEYFYKFAHTTKRKKQQYPQKNQGIFTSLKEMYKDIRYFFAPKKINGIRLCCNRNTYQLFTLVETRARGQGEDDVHREIRIYDVADDRHTTLLSKLQSNLYHNPPTLILQLTQQKLYNQIGIHLFTNTNLNKFKILDIHIPSSSPSSSSSLSPSPTNITLVLTTGTRLDVHLHSGHITLNQIINLPNLDDIINNLREKGRADREGEGAYRREYGQNGENEKERVYGQRDGVGSGFRLIKWQNLGQGDAVVFGVLRRGVVCFGLSKWGENGEMITILDETMVQSEQYGSSLNKSIFIHHDNYQILPCPQLHKSIPKQKLYKLSPHNHPILHYPAPILLQCSANSLKMALKQRPIDLMMSILCSEIYRGSGGVAETGLFGVVERLCRGMEGVEGVGSGSGSGEVKGVWEHVLAMLVQVYCDVDGVYYFQLLKGNKKQQKFRPTNPNPQNHHRLSTINGHSSLYPSRPTQQTLAYPSHNNQSSSASPSPSPRLTLKKYRHSDFCTAYTSSQGTGYCSPIKIRSENSVMRVVEGAIRVIITSQTAKLSKSQPSSLFSTDPHHHQFRLNQLVLGYLGDLLSPIWGVPVRDIARPVYVYIGEVCCKYVELCTRINQLQPQLNFPPLISFLTILTQFNSLLSNITTPISLKYGQAFSQPISYFEQPIFLTLQQPTSSSTSSMGAVQKFRKQFPYYFTNQVFRAVRIQAQISAVEGKQERKDMIIKQINKMPDFLLAWFVRQGAVTAQEVGFHAQPNQSANNARQGRSSKVLVLLESVKDMDQYQKYSLLVSEVEKQIYSLPEKQILLTYSKSALQNCKTMLPQTFSTHSQHIAHLTTTLKFQQQILKSITPPPSSTSTSAPTPPSSPSAATLHLISHLLLTPTQLRKLAQGLDSKPILLMYFACFEGTDVEVQRALGQVGDQLANTAERERLGKNWRGLEMRNILNTILDMGGKISLSVLQPKLDQICSNEILATNLLPYLKHSQSNLQLQFWVPKYLLQRKYKASQLFNMYLTTHIKSPPPIRIPLKNNKQLLYYCINTYILVKGYYTLGAREFQKDIQNILKILAEGGQQVEGGELLLEAVRDIFGN